MATVTKPVALDESLNTTDSTPKNIADVLKDKLGDIASAISGGGGGSGGHTIQNASGANMPQESTMQFKDSHVTDNSQASKTEVEVIKSVASADYSSETEDGLYLIPDGEGSVIEPASEDYVEVTADGVKTYGTLYNELFALVDESKITVDAILEQNGVAFSRAGYVPNSEIEFSYSAIGYQKPYIEMIRLKPSNSIIYRYSNDTFSDISSSVPTNGKTITLYYGNKKAVVDLQTTANRCLMPDGTTNVSDLIDSNVAIWNGRAANVTDSNAVTMVRPDGTEVSSSYTGMIILQTSTSQAGTGSLYMVRSGYMTPVFEGTSARAPRLVIEDGVIKVKLNSDTTGRGVVYTVIKYPS